MTSDSVTAPWFITVIGTSTLISVCLDVSVYKWERGLESLCVPGKPPNANVKLVFSVGGKATPRSKSEELFLSCSLSPAYIEQYF